MPMTFSPSSRHPARALQVWQILVSKAMNRQTITYQALSKMVYRKEAAGVFADVLGHVACFCRSEKLPHLTTIVVGKWTGRPQWELEFDVDVERERVYRTDWFDIYPPSELNFANAWRDFQPKPKKAA
jgi:hypothetical protein